MGGKERGSNMWERESIVISEGIGWCPIYYQILVINFIIRSFVAELALLHTQMFW